jgi:23S rRNA (uracil1939-C5)-methyltransferase
VSTVELIIERPVAGGRMLARLDGRVVLVSGALPGERVRATISRRGKVLWADTQSVIEASPDRREPQADPRCGGALYSHIAYERQLRLKSEVIVDTFRRIAKHPIDGDVAVAPSAEEGYRLRARFHVRGTRLGFLLEGSHALCEASVTRQLSSDAFGALERFRESLGEKLTHCASVTLSEGIAARERVALCELKPETDPGGFAGLTLPEGLTGVAVQARRGMFTAAGADRIVDRSSDVLGIDADLHWTRRAASFFQGNRFVVGALTERVMAQATADRFADLYAGVGLFSVALAARGATGVAVEGDPVSGDDLAANAEQLNRRLDVRRASVEDALAVPPSVRPGVVIVDPPRTGLSPSVAQGLVAWRAPRILYVSCDVPTLARDTALLLAGGYRLTSIEAFDMFPNTPHVECLTVFDRSAPGGRADKTFEQ